jgi:hypothetical protein
MVMSLAFLWSHVMRWILSLRIWVPVSISGSFSAVACHSLAFLLTTCWYFYRTVLRTPTVIPPCSPSCSEQYVSAYREFPLVHLRELHAVSHRPIQARFVTVRLSQYVAVVPTSREVWCLNIFCILHAPRPLKTKMKDVRKSGSVKGTEIERKKHIKTVHKRRRTWLSWWRQHRISREYRGTPAVYPLGF